MIAQDTHQPRPCPDWRCRRAPTVRAGYVGYVCECPNCFDPSEDSPRGALLQGTGSTRQDAICSWNDQLDDMGAA